MPSFPRRSAFGLALSVFTALASIGPVAAADLKTVNIALDWTPNTNHVGLFVAEQKATSGMPGSTSRSCPTPIRRLARWSATTLRISALRASASIRRGPPEPTSRGSMLSSRRKPVG